MLLNVVRFVLGICLLMHGCRPLTAEENTYSTASRNLISVQLIDSVTGYGVNPAEVVVSSPDVRTEPTHGKVKLEFPKAERGSCTSDGGNVGAIEWSGVTNRTGVQPQPTRLIAGGNWTTLFFDLSAEPVWNFSGGNGVLSTASGLGVLEHLAFVPAAGIGAYNVYLDNFAVVRSKRLTFSLDPGAPPGAGINPTNGLFTWDPTEIQGASTNLITVRVTDDGTPIQSDTRSFTVIINEINQAPALAAISNQIIHAGTILRLTNSATDADIPVNILSFTLTNSPGGAGIDDSTGIFTWPTSDAMTGTTNHFTVRVTDNGAPPLSDARTFTVVVASRPALRAANEASAGSVTLTWNAIAGKTYRIQYKDNLNEIPWNDLGPVLTSDRSPMTIEDRPGSNQRFYRIAVDG